MKTTLILSGGMDSTVLAYHLKANDHDLHLMSFDYGQRHRKELECAAWQASALGAPHDIVDISGIRPLLKGSALTDDIAVPHGHYQAENMRLTVVPNRNAIMLSIAWGIACTNGSDNLATGIHAGDHFIYPDCRPDFAEALNAALRLGTDGHRKESLKLIAPFVDWSKTDIAREGLRLGVPFEHTWTCYEGSDKPCGKCGSCVERAESFRDAGGVDLAIGWPPIC